jgi:hypothetical protein
MPERIVAPENCPTCPFGEKRGFLYHCRFYNLGTSEDFDKLPEYCKVKKIVVVEEGGAVDSPIYRTII